jgi:TRAP-type C4-dicarboxylate transport system substrate-binding protein
MNRTRSMAAIAAAVTLLGGGAHGVLAQGDSPVTLRFAVADAEGRPSDPYVHAFVDAVAQRSGGTVTVEPIWDAGGDAFEQGVAHMLVDGQVELAMVAGRGWDDTGIASMQALQAPFLITDDAIALAVATSPVAADMLAGMTAKGITGLALWPEDLRHPVAFEPCMGPLLAPGDFAGRTIRSIPSAATWDLLQTLGAKPISVNGYQDMVASCEIQGAESGLRQGASLPGKPTFTGDVTFYPKFQVLAGNSAALGRLSDAQRAAITGAALAVRDQAVAEHPTEADAAAQWCADGGTVVLAGPDAVAAFEAAAQPVFDRMAADPVSAAAIDAIRGLATGVEPAAGAQACAPAPVPSATPRAIGTPATLPPDGTWRVALTHEDMIAAGASPGNAPAGAYTWTFEGGHAHQDVRYDDGVTEQCDAELRPSGDLVQIVYTAGASCDGEVDDIQWAVDGAGLHLSLVALEGTSDVSANRAYLEAKPWTRVE